MKINMQLYRGLTMLLSLSFMSCAAQAEEDSYTPLFDMKQAKEWIPVECRIETVSGFVLDINQPTVAHCGAHDITVTGISKTRARNADEETTHVRVSIKKEPKKILQVVFRIGNFPAGFIDRVEFADLNGDGQDDFILNLSDHGNGLAAELGGMLYLLSSAKGYRYLAMKDVMNNSPRYMRINDSKVLILQRLALDKNGANSLRGNDGKSHTFFIFDLLQFDVAAPKGIKLANRLDARFPFWTLFSDKPSHVETSKLSSVRKLALWRDPMIDAATGYLVELSMTSFGAD